MGRYTVGEMSDSTKETFIEVDKKLTFTVEEMEQCFKAGCDFGRDMFNNPSNSEYVNGIIVQKGNK